MGKQKVFSKESLMLSQNKNKEQVCRYLEIRQTCFFMTKKLKCSIRYAILNNGIKEIQQKEECQ